MTQPVPDLIDHLAGITPGSPVDRVRARRPEARANAQASFAALLEPAHTGDVSPADRFAIAAFVTAISAEPQTAAYYRERLTELDAHLAGRIDSLAAAAAASGPFGHYPSAALAEENTEGVRFTVPEADRAALGAPLSAALEHAHLLVFRPREASAAALQALLDSGWNETSIVVISQLIAFLTFQLRLVAGLRLLAQDPATTGDIVTIDRSETVGAHA
ncbi:CMD domain protein [Mycetocola tolaasinivorans]|uniref:CMD domain protein n=1 Tax=Mycetocola tolaasinivorans TaxID=76635 RepID=A0A3L7A5P4_9MICO|nr:CMD domain protein [Mycetocola tolaasinivorans]RLP75646.1 CMD domain protein [Mycetocola tolaasinivorans]